MNVLQAIEELQILKDKCAVLNLAIDRLKEDQKDCKNVSSYEIQLLTKIRDEYEVKRKKNYNCCEGGKIMNIARVKFKSWGDTYDYLNDFDLNVGDKVVVETSRGLDIAEVVELAESSDFAFRWVVQKIDDYSYKTKEKNHKEQEWKKINREVGELKIGDIVFSSKHGRLFRLEKLDGENSIFIDIESPYGKTEFEPDELGTIYLTYPIEHRVSIHIDWNDVKVGKEDNVNS